jgi:hypothetical protein
MPDKSNRSTRERNLLALFPAAAVLALYFTLYAMPKRSVLDAQSNDLSAATLVAIDKSVAEAARKNLEYARENLQRLKTRMADDQKKIGSISQNWRGNESRLEVVKEITELARKHNLSILSQAFAEKPRLSEYFEEIIRVMEDHTPSLPLEYWHIELEGGWTSMAGFFSSLDLKRLKIIPLSFSLKATETDKGEHKWTIVFGV